MTINFHPLAEKELQASAKYYESKDDGLGFDFLDEVERLLELRSGYPKIGTPLNHSTRKMILNRLPYAIIYSFEERHGMVRLKYTH